MMLKKKKKKKGTLKPSQSLVTTGKGGWREEEAGRDAKGGAASERSDEGGGRRTGQEPDGRRAGAGKGNGGQAPGDGHEKDRRRQRSAEAAEKAWRSVPEVEIGKDPGGGLNNEEVKGGQHTFVRRGAHKDTAVDKGTRENSGEDSGVTNDNGVDKDLAPAMCEKLDAKGFVLVAFGNGSGMNVDVASARDLEEDNSVFAAMSRGPRHQSGGRKTGIDGRELNNIRTGRGDAWEGPRGYCGHRGGTVGEVTMSFRILKEMTRPKVPLAYSSGKCMDKVAVATTDDIAHVRMATATALVGEGVRSNIAQGARIGERGVRRKLAFKAHVGTVAET
ncbi:hypothetical protein COCOBI_11-2920 [Coccomyxa sp. Obi]|nr:hypothetical protein COCOBI_11-2920 [Coccomyxa sp. Obi]